MVCIAEHMDPIVRRSNHASVFHRYRNIYCIHDRLRHVAFMQHLGLLLSLCAVLYFGSRHSWHPLAPRLGS
ncbi:hypothetical protein IQ06DRAFT_76527 [Phaeosphaeriaceae sp. SRC1lsM3a]|nr:hypothetical protein IQ06DRAFT_76527 [Stagonospora sp. SRC1lsM3a]